MAQNKIYTLVVIKESITAEEDYSTGRVKTKKSSSNYSIPSSEKDKKLDGLVITTAEQHKKLCKDNGMMSMLTCSVFGSFREGQEVWYIKHIEIDPILSEEDVIRDFKLKANEEYLKKYGWKKYKDV